MISRIEKILSSMIDGTSYPEKPQSRIEEILLAIKNNTAYTKTAQSRIEKLLLALKNGDTYTDDAQSRIEEILIAKLNEQEYTQEPQSRIEELFIEWLFETARAYIEGIKPDKDGKKISFVAVLRVPEKFTMKRAGLVAADSEEKVLNNAWDYVKYSTKIMDDTKNCRYTWTKSKVNEGDIWYVRACVVYEDENGAEHTLYGRLVKATTDGEII